MEQAKPRPTSPPQPHWLSKHRLHLLLCAPKVRTGWLIVTSHKWSSGYHEPSHHLCWWLAESRLCAPCSSLLDQGQALPGTGLASLWTQECQVLRLLPQAPRWRWGVFSFGVSGVQQKEAEPRALGDATLPEPQGLHLQRPFRVTSLRAPA